MNTNHNFEGKLQEIIFKIDTTKRNEISDRIFDAISNGTYQNEETQYEIITLASDLLIQTKNKITETIAQ